MIIATTIIAVALSFYPLQGPQEKGISEGGSAQKAATPKHANESQEPPHPPSAPIASQPSTERSKPSTDHDASDVNIQRNIEIFTGVLAGVGVLQLVVMFLTWKVYRRQAGIMGQQRATMQSQWTTMQGQLAQMATQTALLNDTVKAAKDNADAALLNAQAVINSDRPWVIIFAIKERGAFSFHAANVGRTPAEIISFNYECRCIENFRELPAEPEYGTDYAPRIKLLVPSGPELPDKTEFPLLSAEDFVDAASACNQSRKVIAFYFRVLYANPLTRLRPEVPSYESRTCFAFCPSDAGGPLRVWGNDAYNRHT